MYIMYTQVSLSALMNDALIVAKQLDFDVFNALNILGNGVFVSVCVVSPSVSVCVSLSLC